MCQILCWQFNAYYNPLPSCDYFYFMGKEVKTKKRQGMCLPSHNRIGFQIPFLHWLMDDHKQL